MLGELDRETYLGFLEVDYYQRVQEEYGGELGLFGRVAAPKFIDPELMGALKTAEGGVASELDAYLTNRLDGLLEDDSIMEAIDKEIKAITDGDKNQKSKNKNLK